MKYLVILILLLTFGPSAHTQDRVSDSRAVFSPSYSEGEMWDDKAMFCAGVETGAEEKYYGILFYNGKVKKLSIVKDTLHIPGDTVGNSYFLVQLFSAKKVFWRSNLGVNSLDRRNLLHLLDGKGYGWCRPYTQTILTEKLLEKIQEQKFGEVSRSIADDLR